MAAKLNLVKKIVNNEVINSFNLVLNALFGGKMPEMYDVNKSYNKGDVVLVSINGKTEIFAVVKDGTTGPFNENIDSIIKNAFKTGL